MAIIKLGIEEGRRKKEEGRKEKEKVDGDSQRPATSCLITPTN
ncbi:MAG: hypothetical protein SWX82_27510 [Cyanobacteriota bacterium]|nr:hypothetical protein [Cyanobacteriota bacterium]